MAALWANNIAAIFPIIETKTILHGDSLLLRNDKRLEMRREKPRRSSSGVIKKVEASLAAARWPVAKRATRRFQLDLLKSQLKVDHASLYSAQRLQPFFAFMPTKPFPTVVLIAVLVAIATAIKQF